MSTEVKRPRGRPRKIAFGSPEVPPPRLVLPPPELKLSKVHRNLIAQIAREARISPAQVLEDTLDQGIPQVREMYSDLIECRKRLEGRKDEQRRSIERPLPPPANLGSERNGRTLPEFDPGLGQVTVDADVGRGQSGAGEASVAAPESNDRVVAETADEVTAHFVSDY